MKLGLITYHAGYNYGSVFQTFATYRTLQQLGNDVTIINYRPVSQKNNYALVRKHMGYKTLANDILLLPVYNSRKTRFKKFESFIAKHYKLTCEFSDPTEMYDVSKDFDIIVSGSDQLFNIRSEDLAFHGWNNMFPYLLKGVNCKKVSYASSINDLDDDELNIIKDDLISFDYLSSREYSSAKRLQLFLNKDVTPVLDPSLLQDKNFWVKEFNLKKDVTQKYILYFSVNSGIRGGFKKAYQEISYIKPLAEKLGAKIYVVTPFANVYFGGHCVENKNNLSPEEFLNLMYNALIVFTHSFHGIALSINLHKDFYYIGDKDSTDIRKLDLLKRLGLMDRLLLDLDSISALNTHIDYTITDKTLSKLREESFNYLTKAIKY